MGDINLAPQKIYSFPVENPITGDDIPRHFVPRILTVTQIIALKIQGTGTFDWELRYSVNANDQGVGTLIHSDTGVANETTGIIYSSPGDFTAVIPAINWVWLELTLVSTGIARPPAMTVEMIGIESL